MTKLQGLIHLAIEISQVMLLKLELGEDEQCPTPLRNEIANAIVQQSELLRKAYKEIGYDYLRFVGP